MTTQPRRDGDKTRGDAGSLRNKCGEEAGKKERRHRQGQESLSQCLPGFAVMREDSPNKSETLTHPFLVCIDNLPNSGVIVHVLHDGERHPPEEDALGRAEDGADER